MATAPLAEAAAVRPPLPDEGAAGAITLGPAAASPTAPAAARAHLWQAVLDALQADPAISRASFATWLRSTQLLAADQGAERDGEAEFVVAAPHTFARDKLERSFRPAIEQAIARCTGRASVRVRFVLADRQGQEPGQQPHGARVTPGGDAVPAAAPPPGPQPLAPGPQPSSTPGASLLNPRLTFGSFVVGKSNQFAYAAAHAVADNPSFAYNPLYLYGASGTGKTHLLHAIGQRARELRPTLRVVYVSTSALAGRDLGQAPGSSLEALRSACAAADVLLLDDLQDLAAGGARAAEEAFIHILDALHDAHKQVVVAADRPPKAVALSDERLRGRLQTGLVADLGLPDLETRVAIARAKAEALGAAVPAPVLELLARRLPHDVGDLEAAVARVVAAAQSSPLPPTVEHVSAALSSLLGPPPRARATAEQVLLAVSAYFGVPAQALRARRRDKETALPRQVAMYLMRQESGISLAEIGAHLGGRDHSTVLYGCEKIAAALPHDERLRRQIEATRQALLDGAAGGAPAGLS